MPKSIATKAEDQKRLNQIEGAIAYVQKVGSTLVELDISLARVQGLEAQLLEERFKLVEHPTAGQP